MSTQHLTELEAEFLAAAGFEYDEQTADALEDAEEHIRLIEKLIAARDARGLRQKDIAERMGTTQSRVSNIERIGGDPRLSTVQRYGRAVGLRVRFVPVAVDTTVGWEDAGSISVNITPAVEDNAAVGAGWQTLMAAGA